MKKTVFLILILVLVGGIIGGLILHHHLTIPKVEGLAHLKPAKLELFSELTGYSSIHALREENRPAKLIDLPEEISNRQENLFYFSLPIGEKSIPAVIHKPTPGVVKIWIDTNMNLCLSDEKELPGVAKKYKQTKNYTYEYFDFGKTQIKTDGFTSSPFCLICNQNASYCLIQPTSYMKGKIRLGEHIYRIVAIDGNYDGKFTTRYESSADYGNWKCDTFAVDHSSYGLLSRDFYDSGKIVPLGKYYKFTKERYAVDMPADENTLECYFNIELSEDGKNLKMQPAKPAMGILKIGDSRRLSIRLLSDTATQDINFRDEIKLPAGRYQMLYGKLSYDDGNRSFKYYADFREDIRKGTFEILEGETITLNPGPPFAIKSQVFKRNDDELYINAGLIGNEGEEYGLRISKNMPKPTLNILDENETVLHTGTMEYG